LKPKQVDVAAAVQGKPSHFLAFDDISQLGIRRFNLCLSCLNTYRFSHDTQNKMEIRTVILAHQNLDAELICFLKPLRLNDLKLETLVKRQRAVSNSLGPQMATESALSYLPCASISCQTIEFYNDRRLGCIPSVRIHEPQTSYRLGEPSWQETEKYRMWL
jgi:hypothetical protein